MGDINRLIDMGNAVNECLISVTGKLQTDGISAASRTLKTQAEQLVLFETSFSGIFESSAQDVSLSLSF